MRREKNSCGVAGIRERFAPSEITESRRLEAVRHTHPGDALALLPIIIPQASLSDTEKAMHSLMWTIGLL